MVSSVITCPLDVVKTKLQAQGGLLHSSQAVDSYEGLIGNRIPLLFFVRIPCLIFFNFPGMAISW